MKSADLALTGSPFGVLKVAFHKITLPLHERQAFDGSVRRSIGLTKSLIWCSSLTRKSLLFSRRGA